MRPFDISEAPVSPSKRSKRRTNGNRRPVYYKLCRESIKAIRAAPKEVTNTSLALKYNVTPQQIGNVRRKKSWAKLENLPEPKLTIDQIREIRRLKPNGTSGPSYSSLAKKYDVGRATLHDIVHYVTWKNI